MNGQNGDGDNGSYGSPNSSTQSRKPLEAEIVETPANSQAGSGRGADSRRTRYYTGKTITFAPIDNSGCLAAFITLCIFMACLFQWGLLAAIGFIVFHTIGNIISSIHSARQLMRGFMYNIWNLRIINWLISFFLTAWLAGGFNE